MSKSKDMSFLDHLEELRWHLIRSVLSILIFGFVAFLAKEIIFDTIIFLYPFFFNSLRIADPNIPL